MHRMSLIAGFDTPSCSVGGVSSPHRSVRVGLDNTRLFSCTSSHHRAKSRVYSSRIEVVPVLTPAQRTKENNNKDTEFYSTPRLVHHCDASFRSDLQRVYSTYLSPERINSGGVDAIDPNNLVILDLGASHVSHIPKHIADSDAYTIIGHGMNAEELARNPCLDRSFIRDFNSNPSDPWALSPSSVDAVLCACTVQYFQYPEDIFAQIHRVLKPGGICLISFTNRMFWDKAIKSWRDSNDYGRIQLVKQYIMSVKVVENGTTRHMGFTMPETLQPPLTGSEEQPNGLNAFIDSLRTMITSQRDPFYCVACHKTL